MDKTALLANGLLMYICLVMIVTFHEFGHAWMAGRLGDDTQREQGRLTLNPLAHLDLVGTVVLPLLFVFAGALDGRAAGLLFGWGKSVMVDVSRLRNRRWHGLWITLAGPAMNIVLTVLALLVAVGAKFAGQPTIVDFCRDLAVLSMYLFFFNLLPVPPLDGGNALHSIVGMKEETYLRLSQYGILILFLIIFAMPGLLRAMGLISIWIVAQGANLLGLV